jgi:hypothetical protein
VIIINENAIGGTIEVVKLPISKTPQECSEANCSKRQGCGNEEKENVHVNLGVT